MRAKRLWLTAVLGAVALASVHGCKKQSELEGTALLVDVTLSGVSADQLRYTGFDIATDAGVFGPALRPDPPAAVPSSSTERVLLKDELAGQTLDVWVEALEQGSSKGAGHQTVTVVKGMEVHVGVTISAAMMMNDGGCEGCFSGGQCVTSSLHACGPKGSVCTDCGIHADTCSNGDCRCGSGAPCLASGADLCDNGQCKSSCAGCIDTSSGQCVSSTFNDCGGNGGACVKCDQVASDTCGSDNQCHCGIGPPCTPLVGGNNCGNNGVCQCGTQPACGSGMECLNGTCVCTTSSCPNGCCQGNVCVTGDSMSACGRGGGACLDCGGTECDGGTCAMALCNSTNCAGCCSGASCLTSGGDAGCGTGGSACTQCGSTEICSGGACISSCGPTTCDGGCCDRNGTCQAGSDPSLCGTGGLACSNCGGNQCIAGSCNGGGCGPANCVGCCDGGTCITPSDTPSACGVGGNVCSSCGANPCDGGACVTCSPANCSGCCSGGVCQPGTVKNACGTGGASCTSCAQSATCDAGACFTGCNSSTCDGGCCDSSGVCQQKSITNCSGMGGSLCVACPVGISDSCGSNGCRCGTRPVCSPGNLCATDGGGCVCDPTTCMGCCGGNPYQCQAGTAKQACGIGGVACTNCVGNMKCSDAGVCQ